MALHQGGLFLIYFVCFLILYTPVNILSVMLGWRLCDKLSDKIKYSSGNEIHRENFFEVNTKYISSSAVKKNQ